MNDRIEGQDILRTIVALEFRHADGSLSIITSVYERFVEVPKVIDDYSRIVVYDYIEGSGRT